MNLVINSGVWVQKVLLAASEDALIHIYTNIHMSHIIYVTHRETHLQLLYIDNTNPSHTIHYISLLSLYLQIHTIATNISHTHNTHTHTHHTYMYTFSDHPPIKYNEEK